MSEQEIEDFRNPEDYSGFEYYELNGQPLRVALNHEGNQAGGDRFDAENARLYRDNTVLGDVFKDEECTKISEDEFYELCAQLIAEKKTEFVADGQVFDGGPDF